MNDAIRRQVYLLIVKGHKIILHPWFYILRHKSWLNKNYKIYIIGSLGNYRLYENQHHSLEATRKTNSRFTIVLFITERNY